MGDSEKNLADGKLSDDIIVEDVAVKTASNGKSLPKPPKPRKHPTGTDFSHRLRQSLRKSSGQAASHSVNRRWQFCSAQLVLELLSLWLI